MSRWLTRRGVSIVAAAGVLVAAGVTFRATQSSAKQGDALVRGNKPGEWRYWGADAFSTRYSDASQINASTTGEIWWNNSWTPAGVVTATHNG